MEDNKLVKFPSKSKALPTLESVVENVTNDRLEFIDEITEFIRDDIWKTIEISGFDLTERNNSMFCLLAECLRAIIFDKFDMEHPLYTLSDFMVVNNENGTISIRMPQFAILNNTTENSDADN